VYLKLVAQSGIVGDRDAAAAKLELCGRVLEFTPPAAVVVSPRPHQTARIRTFTTYHLGCPFDSTPAKLALATFL
jgi:hypothetical protein